MMRILLLGTGMQGKAALYDLARSDDVTDVVAADGDLDALRAHLSEMDYGARVHPEALDAADPDSLARLFARRPDVAIDLLPVSFSDAVAQAAVAHGVHLVNTIYTTPFMRTLAAEAQARGVTLLPEFGLDPGIDLLMLSRAAREVDSIEGVKSYGAGIPELAAADNPIKYKITWTFHGVLTSYRREARLIRDGQLQEIDGRRIFYPEQLHDLTIEGVGLLEAYPNGDALPYVDLLGLDVAQLAHMGRYSLRYPGHSRFWRALVDLDLLEDEPVMVDGQAVDRKRFLAAAMAPRLQLGPGERDIVILRVDLWGKKDGRPARVVTQLIDRRDLDTGFTAMNRTVGFTASIGAQLIGRGTIDKRGLLSPVTDVPCDIVVDELAKRDIHITSV
ncbi:MAG: saccharopine dehydrogenase family protein [Candidatus Promineifilaceae bacterium]